MAKPRPSETDDDGVHDVLAAEAFQMPAADPDLHHGPVVLPEDPTGNAEAHDILAAEEFAMPAPSPYHPAALAQRRGGWGRFAVEAAAAVLVLRAVLRRRRR
jgi:hypothetical protein